MKSSTTKSYNNEKNCEDEELAAAKGAQLLAAAYEGQGDEVVRMVEENPELLRVGDPIGDTALHVLARAGHVDALRGLIKYLQAHHKELLSTVAKQGNGNRDTPLHLSFKNKHEKVAFMLLDAEPMSQGMLNEDGKSPLDLIEHHDGCDDCYSQSACSDIQIRVSVGDIEDDKIFEKDKIDEKMIIQHKTKEGNTMFHKAACSGNMNMLTKLSGLIKSSNKRNLLLERNNDGNTALHLALLHGNNTAARYLIEEEPEAAYQLNNKGESPLSLAFQHGGNDDLVRHMLQIKTEASVSPATILALLAPNKESLVHAVIRKRKLTMLKAILESLPSLIDSKDDKGWKPLSYAAYKGYIKEVKFLINRYPKSVERFDGDGSLPIHKAITGGHISIFREFISCHPLALNGKDTKGRNILYIANRYRKTDICNYLKEHHADTYLDLAKKINTPAK